MEKDFRILVNVLLGSDEGIPEESYNSLREFAWKYFPRTAEEIARHTDATDGEFYFPTGFSLSPEG